MTYQAQLIEQYKIAKKAFLDVKEAYDSASTNYNEIANGKIKASLVDHVRGSMVFKYKNAKRQKVIADAAQSQGLYLLISDNNSTNNALLKEITEYAKKCALYLVDFEYLLEVNMKEQAIIVSSAGTSKKLRFK